MTQDKEKGVESTHSSVPSETAVEMELRLLRQTVMDMNRNMADMRANQEYTAKLLQDQTESMRQRPEPAQSVKSPEKQNEHETSAQERVRKGKMPQEQSYIVESPRVYAQTVQSPRVYAQTVESPRVHVQTERPNQGYPTEMPTRGRCSDNI